MVQPDITLYTVSTDNGWKAFISLEVLRLRYKTKTLSFAKNEQRRRYFTLLAQNYDPEHKLWPNNAKQQSEAVQWLIFQMRGVNPIQGQANHFKNYATVKTDYAINRYINETKRLYLVLESRLIGRDYLVADQLTVADISSFTWVWGSYALGSDLNEFSSIMNWVRRIENIPEVSKGLDVPEPNKHKIYKNDPGALKNTWRKVPNGFKQPINNNKA